MMDIAVNQKWSYKGVDYYITEIGLKSKDADSGNWHDAVKYSSAGPDFGKQHYVRQVDDFQRKFAPIDG